MSLRFDSCELCLRVDVEKCRDKVSYITAEVGVFSDILKIIFLARVYGWRSVEIRMLIDVDQVYMFCVCFS